MKTKLFLSLTLFLFIYTSCKKESNKPAFTNPTDQGFQFTTGSLSEARYNIAGAAFGNKFLFAGGIKTSNMASNTVDIYDAANDTWSTAQLSQARAAMSAASAGGKIAFAGGLLESHPYGSHGNC